MVLIGYVKHKYGLCLQYNTIHYTTIQYNTVQYNTIQYNTIQYNTIQYNTIQYIYQNRVYFWGFSTPEQGGKFNTGGTYPSDQG